MAIIGWIVWAFTAFMAVTFLLGTYRKMKQGQSVHKATVIQAISLVIISIAFLFGDWNKLNIIWIAIIAMILSSFIVNFTSAVKADK